MNIAIKGHIGVSTAGTLVTGGYFAFKSGDTKKVATAKKSLLETLNETKGFVALSMVMMMQNEKN